MGLRHLFILAAFILASAISASAADGMTSKNGPDAKGTFAWGAEAGGSIDMSANDMSSIDFTACFGYKRGWIKFAGIGAEIDIMLNNSCRSFPIYASFKTNFINRPSLLFMDIRGGVSLNYLPNNYDQSGAYAFGGLGINLARGKKFASHIVIGYTFKDYHNFTSRQDETIKMNDLHLMTVRLGVIF